MRNLDWNATSVIPSPKNQGMPHQEPNRKHGGNGLGEITHTIYLTKRGGKERGIVPIG